MGLIAGGLTALGVGATTAAAIAPAVIGIGGNLISSAVGGGAATSAADAQVQSAKDALALQRDEFNTQQANIKPWLTAGGNALTALSSQLGLTNGQGYQESPGYQFQFNEGQRAVNSTMNAQGLYGSGARAKALTEFGQGVANQDYGNWLNRLQSVAGLGQTGVGQGIAAGTNFANQSSNLLQDAGTARASGYVGTANAISGGIGQLTNNLSTLAANNWGQGYMPLTQAVNQSIAANPNLF